MFYSAKTENDEKTSDGKQQGAMNLQSMNDLDIHPRLSQ